MTNYDREIINNTCAKILTRTFDAVFGMSIEQFLRDNAIANWFIISNSFLFCSKLTGRKIRGLIKDGYHHLIFMPCKNSSYHSITHDEEDFQEALVQLFKFYQIAQRNLNPPSLPEYSKYWVAQNPGPTKRKESGQRSGKFSITASALSSAR